MNSTFPLNYCQSLMGGNSTTKQHTQGYRRRKYCLRPMLLFFTILLPAHSFAPSADSVCPKETRSVIDIRNPTWLTNSSSIAVEGNPFILSSPPPLLPLEVMCLLQLDVLYEKSQTIKCPFFRRRFGDFLDIAEAVVKHTLIRRECWPLMGAPQAFRPVGSNQRMREAKYRGLSLGQLKKHVIQDWDVESGKGYYITGKLTTAIYRDDCLFDGDDPDQPIKGVRKYIGVAARLFDYKTSNCTLKSLDIVEDALVANWKLEATLRLPWKPRLPTMHGSTRYSFDDDGLIARHEESWDMPALEAFGRTFFPDFWCKGHSLSDSET